MIEELCYSLHKMNITFQGGKIILFSSFPGEKSVKETGKTRPLRQLACERGRIQMALLISWSSAYHSFTFLSHFLCACQSRTRTHTPALQHERELAGETPRLHNPTSQLRKHAFFFPLYFFLFLFYFFNVRALLSRRSILWWRSTLPPEPQCRRCVWLL